MTPLEYYLIAIFAAVWLVPLAMAVRWERRLRNARTRSGSRATDRERRLPVEVPAA